MRISFLIIFILILSGFCAFGQSLNIQGKVIDTGLEGLPGVDIYVQDTILLARADLNGNFKLTLSEPTRLSFRYLGMETEEIMVSAKCSDLEIIMIYAGSYHIRSHRKIDRLRKKDFDGRMKFHEQAFKQGIFTSAIPCFKYKFIPDKPELDEIRDWMNKKKIEIREEFNQLNIGDTIYVPYHGSSTNKVYSAYSDYINYDCLITGIVLNKDKKKRGFNIHYKVINMDNCIYKSLTHKEQVVKVGDTIEYNMRHCRLIKASKLAKTS